MALQIRRAEEQDIPQLEQLYRKRVLYNERKGIPQWTLQDVKWETLCRTYRIGDFYMLFDIQLIACCCIVDVDPVYWPGRKKGDSLYLHKIATDPDYEKQGYGDIMLSFFKEKGRREGYPDVRLDVRAHKQKLRSFYERNGFQLMEVRSIFQEYQTALYVYAF